MSTERPLKRLRADPPPAPDNVRNGFLETVTDDSLRIVLRHLSCRPQHKNWHAYTSPLWVNTVLDVGGALARAALSEFHSIGGDGIPIETTLAPPVFHPLVCRLPLRRLVFEFGESKVLSNFLRDCGAKLKELVVDARWAVVTEADIFAISTYCTRLSLLAIRGNCVEGTLASIWRSLGSTLTRVYIGCYYSTSGYRIANIISLPNLVENCVTLHRVDVQRLYKAITDVLVALGSRIRVLSVEDEFVLRTGSWREVLRACTNLEAVYLKIPRYNSEESIDVLSSMRTKLVSLTLRNPDDLDYLADRFFAVLSACSVLKQVEIRVLESGTEAQLRKLFESLKSVTTLTCGVNKSDVNPTKDIVDVIACSLTNLESLTIFTFEPLKGEDVSALVALPRLASVAIRPPFYVESDPKRAEECAVEIVKKLKDCEQLVQLEIVDRNIKNRFPLIAEAAVMYKRKDFDMFIGGVQYRTR